jgi:hypothetical protein
MSPVPPRHRCAVLAAVSILGVLALSVGANAQSGYVEPVVTKALFAGEGIELLEVDRDKLASSIAAFVVNGIKPDDNARKLANAQRFIGLALHLNPRNRTAVVANYQFKRGVAPKKIDPDYSPATLAEVLQARAGTLVRRGGDLNLMLAGYMLAAAVEIDPSNETAVYELEMYRKDIAEVDWTPVVGRVRSGTVRGR